MLWQLGLLFLYSSHAFANHYETIGVSRSATDYDIKKAYKKLARIWHPDKSRTPGANERFMKINEAYEVLSDPEKRKEYDAFGTVSNEPRGGDGFNRNNFWNSNFGNAFFQTDETKETRFETVDYRNYKMNIFPESNKRPTLLLLITHFCMACHQAIRLWGNIADQVTDSGIRMGISDVMRDSRLREELKIHHVPSIVFVIDGQLKYMQADITKETIIEFLRQSFPRDLVTLIYSGDDLNRFHDLWMKDSRAKMIMTKPLERPSFRYLTLAFKYRDKVTAGFLHLDENDVGRSQEIVNDYRLDFDKETLLIFYDEKQNYNRIMLPKPVVQISQSRLTINEMEHNIQSNSQLPLPRLLSQSVFDTACQPPSQKHRSYGFCVIAIVHSKHRNNLSEADNWQYLRSLVDEQNSGKMLYLYGDIQFEFLKSLQLFDHSPSDADAFINQVILLWRQSYGSAASMFLSNPWEYPNLDWVLRNWDLLANLDTAVPILTSKNRVQSKFADSETLSELIDELAAPLVWRIWARTLVYSQQIFTFLYDNLLDPFTLIIVVMAFMLLSYSYSTIKAVSRHVSDETKVHPKSSNPTNNISDKEMKHNIRELTPDSYKSLLSGNQPGKMVIIILTTNLTPADTVAIVVNCIQKLKCKTPLEPLYLMLDKNTNWITGLLGNVTDAEDQKKAIAMISSLSINRPVSEEGIVFALNISRNYFFICPINMLLGSPFPFSSTTNGDSHLKKRCLQNSTYYIESDDSSDEISSAANSNLVENKFFDWLCQLTDGTCKRYYLKYWPNHL